MKLGITENPAGNIYVNDEQGVLFVGYDLEGAKEIVKRVNLYDELIGALQSAYRELNIVEGNQKQGGYRDHLKRKNFALEEVLTKATDKPQGEVIP